MTYIQTIVSLFLMYAYVALQNVLLLVSRLPILYIIVKYPAQYVQNPEFHLFP